ncbi:MAG: hypothetical protein GY839_15275 [candidate division Zixibacteria bacterium]|nr:hypothetical protein [candidate division Zixibacteria bacterium]
MIKPLALILISLMLVGCHAGFRKKIVKAEQKPEKKYDIPLRPDGYPTQDAFVPYDVAPEEINQPKPNCAVLDDFGGNAIVWVNALIDTTGHIVDVTILKSHTLNYDGCEEAAIENAYNTIWSPAINNGKPIPVWVSYRIIFEID